MDNQELIITAQLAHLNLSEKEIAVFSQAASQFLDYFKIMDELDVSEYGTDPHLQHDETMREDSPHGTDMSGLVKNAEEHEDGFILLPNIL